MMAVIVDDMVIGGKVLGFKAPLGPGKRRQRTRHQRKCRAAAIRQRDGSKCIEHVVATGDAELDVA